MAQRFRFIVACLLIAVALAAGCRDHPAQAPPTSTPSASLDRLLYLMQQRLVVMHDIARWKWAHGKPISDPVREAQVLDAVAERGPGRDLDPVFVRSFF